MSPPHLSFKTFLKSQIKQNKEKATNVQSNTTKRAVTVSTCTARNQFQNNKQIKAIWPTPVLYRMNKNTSGNVTFKSKKKSV